MSDRPTLATAALIAMALLVGCAALDATAPAAPTVTVVSPQPAVPAGLEIPVRVRIPAIGVDSDLLPTGMLPSGELEVPPLDQPEQASAVDWSPAMAATVPTVILGHVDGAGRPGVFAALVTLPPGSEVLVDRGGQTQRYVVTSVESVPKGAFPWERLLSGGPDQLRLITCGGDLVSGPAGRTHEDNIVALAEPVE